MSFIEVSSTVLVQSERANCNYAEIWKNVYTRNFVQRYNVDMYLSPLLVQSNLLRVYSALF